MYHLWQWYLISAWYRAMPCPSPLSHPAFITDLEFILYTCVLTHGDHYKEAFNKENTVYTLHIHVHCICICTHCTFTLTLANPDRPFLLLFCDNGSTCAQWDVRNFHACMRTERQRPLKPTCTPTHSSVLKRESEHFDHNAKIKATIASSRKSRKLRLTCTIQNPFCSGHFHFWKTSGLTGT